jgi:PEGA domain-containing protein
MKRRAATLTIACVLLAWPGMATAKGGGHGGGGHSSGGHSGGHSTASHGSGGHRSGGHPSSTGQTSSGRSAASQTPSTSPHRTGGSPAARGRTGTGQPTAETAVPRPAAPTVVLPTPGVTGLLPAYPLFGLSGGFGLYSFSGWPIGYADAFGAGDAFSANGPTGGLRLKIEPTSAQVFVDGEYAGVVDDFNGRFHHLDLAPGPHHLEVRADGYEPLALDVIIQPHHTIKYTATLAPSAP